MRQIAFGVGIAGIVVMHAQRAIEIADHQPVAAGLRVGRTLAFEQSGDTLKREAIAVLFVELIAGELSGKAPRPTHSARRRGQGPSCREGSTSHNAITARERAGDQADGQLQEGVEHVRRDQRDNIPPIAPPN